MKNQTQLDRYKKLLTFIEENLKEDINIQKIEEICHYSYRNINRIFQALHQETIGKYVKRLRLEKAAQYLKYSDISISDIAFEIGFEDRAAFSKAFKKKYDCSPSTFREKNESVRIATQKSLLKETGENRAKLQFEIEYLPNFEYFFLEYRGSYEDSAAIEEVITQVYNYAKFKKVVNKHSIFMTEIVDDSEISDHIHLRYNLGFILEKPLKFQPEGLFRTKQHKQQKYAKFIHQGSHQSSIDFYDKLYAFWISDIGLEMKDRPVLEFYPNAHKEESTENMLTEIYIPVE